MTIYNYFIIYKIKVKFVYFQNEEFTADMTNEAFLAIIIIILMMNVKYFINFINSYLVTANQIRRLYSRFCNLDKGNKAFLRLV